MKIFLNVISPLCKPIYATVALFVAVGQWNSWFDTMLYNRMADQYTTLQYELMKMLSAVTSLKGNASALSGHGLSVFFHRLSCCITTAVFFVKEFTKLEERLFK